MAYYRMDEAAGGYLYDLSRTGSVYHKNNSNLNTDNGRVDNCTSLQQFGILGLQMRGILYHNCYSVFRKWRKFSHYAFVAASV
jgi:hypothetical protein